MRATSPRVALTMWLTVLPSTNARTPTRVAVLRLPGGGVGAGAHVDDQALVRARALRSGSRHSAGSEAMRGSVEPIESR